MKILHTDDIGEIAYIAYGNYVEWKNFQGERMPDFADLPPKIQNAWRVSAEAVKASGL